MNYEMFIFTIILCHFFADYVFQSTWLWEKKKTKIWPLIVHCIIYTGCINYALGNWLSEVSWLLIGFVFLSHLIVDRFKIWFEAKRWHIMPDDDWFPTFIDQTLHLLVILGIIIKYRWG